ncbi:MAG: hypothetical protein HUU20_25375, partial [Pirellulales bacterium]|nr:hypothetical protein [Pirellulales bacterium]
MKIARLLLLLLLLLPAFFAAGKTPAEEPLFVVQSNDIDPTTPSSQAGNRWYHWIGVDPVVSHLETGLAIDSDQFAGRGQRMDVQTDAPISAVQLKVKRIGNPGPLRWEMGSGWGKADLGSGRVSPQAAGVQYERFVTLAVQPAPVKQIFLRLKADSGRCPDDYYAVYCTWSKTPDEQTVLRSYIGVQQTGMMYRMLQPDGRGAALDADGKPVGEGASMMTRLLAAQGDPGRRAILPGEEEPYRFVDDLTAGIDPRLAGLPRPDAKAEEGEIVLSQDWKIRVAAPRSPQVETAVADLQQFLRERMRIEMAVAWEKSEHPAASRPGRAERAILLSQGPDLPDGPRRAAGYRFEAATAGVRIHGFDGPGV